MEGQNVDRASLAELVERHLGRDNPVRRSKDAHDFLDGRGVTPVEESVESLALPEQLDEHTPAELSGNAIERPDGDSRRATLLDPGDHAAR